jgi:hypothetical protein
MPKTNPRQFENINLGQLSPMCRLHCLNMLKQYFDRQYNQITYDLQGWPNGGTDSEAGKDMIAWRDGARALSIQCHELYVAQLALVGN